MNQSLGGILGMIGNLMNIIIPMLITVIVIFVIWKAIQFAGSKDSTKRKEARDGLVAGIIALAVVLSLFGLVRILQNTVLGGGVQNTTGGQGLIRPQVTQ